MSVVRAVGTVGAITPLEIQLEMTPSQLRAENRRLRLTIAAGVDRLGAINGEHGQDVEAEIAVARDCLLGALGPDAVDEGESISLHDVEMAHIRRVLARHHGNKPEAAKELGVSLKTLYNKIHQIEAAAAHLAVIGNPAAGPFR